MHKSLVRAQFGEPKKKALLRKCFLFIQSEGLAWNLTAGEDGIRRERRYGTTRQRAFSFGLIPYKAYALITYRRQAADYIHGLAVIYRVAFCYPSQ